MPNDRDLFIAKIVQSDIFHEMAHGFLISVVQDYKN